MLGSRRGRALQHFRNQHIAERRSISGIRLRRNHQAHPLPWSEAQREGRGRLALRGRDSLDRATDDLVPYAPYAHPQL